MVRINGTLSGVKRIAAATALLTAIGGGAALAQGCPPGHGSWTSGWANFLAAEQARGMSGPRATPTNPGNRVAKKDGPIPVANGPLAYRRS